MICSALSQNGKARICNSRWAFRTFWTVTDLIRWGKKWPISTTGNSVGGTGCTYYKLSLCQSENMKNRSKTLVESQIIAIQNLDQVARVLNFTLQNAFVHFQQFLCQWSEFLTNHYSFFNDTLLHMKVEEWVNMSITDACWREQVWPNVGRAESHQTPRFVDSHQINKLNFEVVTRNPTS